MNLNVTLDKENIVQSLRDYGRGAVGGLLIGLPLLFTMEMWWLGISMSPCKMLLFYAMNFGILLILETYSGFREDSSFLEEVQDAVVALGIGTLVSAAVLALLHVIRQETSFQETIGKIILESLPVSIGVSVAVAQFGDNSGEGEAEKEKKERAHFWGRRAIALAGAVFFGFNVAPTEEPMLVGLQMTPTHCLIMVAISLLLVYAITYSLDFHGSAGRKDDHHPVRLFIREVLPTYMIALCTSIVLLWIFGRFEPVTSIAEIVHMTIALGFITSLGAATGALIL